MKMRPVAARLIAGFVGAAVGVGVTVLFSGWIRVLPPAVREADIAWQGWIGSLVGALIGALLSAGVAFAVLRATLRQAHQHFLSGQRTLALEVLAADERRRAEAAEATERFREQVAAERALALEQHKLEAWGELTASLRQLMEFHITAASIREVSLNVSAALYVWRLYVPESQLVIANGVETAVSQILSRADTLASEKRRELFGFPSVVENQTIQDGDISFLIRELQVHYEAWSREGSGRSAAEEWFANLEDWF